MRLATFNLESLDLRRGGEAALERRIAVMAPQMDRLRADVLCLQEVNGQKPEAAEGDAGAARRQPLALEKLLAATAYAGYHLVTSTAVSGGGLADVHNLALASRFPILEVRELRNDLVPPRRYEAVTAVPRESGGTTLAWDRPLLYCLLQLPGGLLHVINLHLRSPLAAPIPGQKTAAQVWSSVAGWADGLLAATIMRSGQALEARLLVEQLFDREPQALIAVCGDLNAGVEETPARILRAAVEDNGNPALAARALHLLEQALPAERRYSVIHGGRRLMFDHILASPALHSGFTGIEALNDALPDEVEMAEDDPRSNHAPLVAEFDL
ncbi:endonuclease [Pelagibius litoralis]|uniref:Endonuclease n=1 Tax=Pelagibius litoralis TaxID=374515 RepID=A0A967F1Y2_9PROT|nr:endonuclease/exonuclease/phosphatase family protein [Pelagibius litoralis]NIA71634.1 endonuclease [Pelagibius litoralis]